MSNSTHDKPASLTSPPAGYADWLAELKGCIHTAQQRATPAVNRELVLLYCQIGRGRPSRAGARRQEKRVAECRD